MEKQAHCPKCLVRALSKGTPSSYCVIPSCSCHLPPKKNSWEERFDREYPFTGRLIYRADGLYISTFREIKSFIRSLLSEERERMVERVEKMQRTIDPYTPESTKEQLFFQYMSSGYNQALYDVLAILKENE